MTFVRQPWHLFLTILAVLISRQQQEIIEYLRAENQVLKEAHGKRRIRLKDDQRRRLAVKGKVLGRKVLGESSLRKATTEFLARIIMEKEVTSVSGMS